MISRKGKSKLSREHILKDSVPRGFNARIAEIQRQHQLAITDCDIKAIQYESVALQGEIRNACQTETNFIENIHVSKMAK